MKKQEETTEYRRQTGMSDQKIILERLRREGYRITRQRQELLAIILEENCASCKEIYYKAAKSGLHVGRATVYRMLNLLESIGALRWRNSYQICEEAGGLDSCLVELEDASRIELHGSSIKQVFEKGMEICGYTKGKKVKQVMVSRDFTEKQERKRGSEEG